MRIVSWHEKEMSSYPSGGKLCSPFTLWVWFFCLSRENIICTCLLLSSCQKMMIILRLWNPGFCPTSFWYWQVMSFSEMVSSEVSPAKTLTASANEALIWLPAWSFFLLYWLGVDMVPLLARKCLKLLSWILFRWIFTCASAVLGLLLDRTCA